MENLFSGGSFEIELLDVRDGLIIFKVKGKGVEKVFANESGGHRFQAVSPTGKKGRIHTSTITVVVLPELAERDFPIKENDLEWSVCRSGGSGGQNVNKTNTAVQVKHIPSGITVRIESRSQSQNRNDALSILRAKLDKIEKERIYGERAADRKQQQGSGMRGDKIRTIRVQDGIVNDHRLGKKIQYKDYSRGIWDDLIGA